LIDRADEFAPDCGWLTQDERKRLDRLRKRLQKKGKAKESSA
jgi:hypothetical protein